jgi:peptide/nickel transport system substrate-binding protein
MGRGSSTSLAAAILALVVAVSACGGAQPSSKKGGTLVYAIPFSVASLDPHRENEDTTSIVIGQVYDTLVHVNPDQPTKLDPGLASNWEANSDNTTFTLHLRKNAVFSTGNPVTADDVKFSLDRLWNLQASPSFIMQGVKSVDVVDPFTVRITTAAPDGALLNKLSFTMTAIIDSKAAKEQGATSDAQAATTDKAEAYFNAVHTLGSGPFMISAYVPNDQFVLVRNPHYWGSKSGPDKVILKDIPDSTTQRQLLERGDIDIAAAIDYATAEQLRNTSGLKIGYAHSLNLIYLFMTGSPAVSAPLSNKLVHQAVAHAIDYGSILKLASGHAQQPPTTIPLGLLGADTVSPPKYDVALAKQLMAQAGYAAGFEVPFTYANEVKYNIDCNLLAQILQSNLAQIGIKLDLKPVTEDEFFAKFRSRNDPFGFSFWTPDYVDPDDYTGPFWASDVNFLTRRLQWKNPAVDALYPKSLSTTGQERIEVYRQLQKLFQDDPVMIGLIQPDYVLAYRNRVSGFKLIWELRMYDFSRVTLS